MKRGTSQQMLERVKRRAMPNHEDCAGIELPRDLTEPSGDPLHHLLVAFATGERSRDMERPSLVDLGKSGHLVKSP